MLHVRQTIDHYPPTLFQSNSHKQAQLTLFLRGCTFSTSQNAVHCKVIHDILYTDAVNKLGIACVQGSACGDCSVIQFSSTCSAMSNLFINIKPALNNLHAAYAF